MKKKNILIALAVALVGTGGLGSSVYAEMSTDVTSQQVQELREEMTIREIFPDENLAQAVANLLGLEVGDFVSDNQLLSIYELRLFRANIENLEGIQYLTNLEYLVLSFNQISDITPLAHLTNLRDLYLWGNQISDISPLANLMNLDWLSLGDNQISDVSPLANLTNLRFLWLENNQIRDLRPLANLTNIIGLGATGQSILLEPGIVGTPIQLGLYNVDGSRPEVEMTPGVGTYEDGTIIWEISGDHTLRFTGQNFSGTIRQTVEEG